MDNINTESLWGNPAIDRMIERTDPEQFYVYQKMAHVLLNKTIKPNEQLIKLDVASQVKFMLRDGIYVNMLTPEEKQIYIDIYGLKSLNDYEKDDINRGNGKSSSPK